MGLFSYLQRAYFLYEVHSGVYMIDHFHKVWLNTVLVLSALLLSVSCWHYLPRYLLVAARCLWGAPLAGAEALPAAPGAAAAASGLGSVAG